MSHNVCHYDDVSEDVADCNEVAFADGDERIFNSPVSFMDRCPEQEQQDLSTLPPYSRLA